MNTKLESGLHPIETASRDELAALHERSDQVERGRRLGVGGDHATGVGPARLGLEFGRIDDVAAVAVQFHAVPDLLR